MQYLSSQQKELLTTFLHNTRANHDFYIVLTPRNILIIVPDHIIASSPTIGHIKCKTNIHNANRESNICILGECVIPEIKLKNQH